MCGKAMESVPHVLSGCSVLAQSKYKTRHDAALKVLFFDLLCDMGLIERAPSWCSPETPKPWYKNDRASPFRDVPVYAEKTEVRENRIDARDVEKKRVLLSEMSCSYMANRKEKEEEKTTKYAPLRWEIHQQYPHYKIAQYNIIIDVLGGVSRKTLVLKNLEVSRQIRSYWICKKQSSQVPLTLHGVSKFSLRRSYELAKLLPIFFLGS